MDDTIKTQDEIEIQKAADEQDVQERREKALDLYERMRKATPETILPLVNEYLTLMNDGVETHIDRMPRNSCPQCHGRGYVGRDVKTGLLFLCRCCAGR